MRSIRFKTAQRLLRAPFVTDFALPNIPDAALQNHYKSVANRGFLRRNCHELIAGRDDDPVRGQRRSGAGAPPVRAIKTCSPGCIRRRRGLKRKSWLTENRGLLTPGTGTP
jgi:hypothetical protein